MKTRKAIPLVLILGILAALFAACSGNNANPSPSTPVTSSAAPESTAPGKEEVDLGDSVTIWMKKMQVDSMNTKFEEKCNDLAKEYGTDVVCEIIAYEDFPQKWAAGIESGQVPDLSFMTYAEVGLYYADNLLLDVTDTVNGIQEKNGAMFENLMDPITFEGKNYMIPMWTESQILYYRTDIIDTPPQTWAEFKQIAKEVSEPSRNFYGAGIGFGKGNSDAEWLTRAMLWSYGAYLVDENGKAAINSPEAKELAQLIYDMYAVDKSIPSSANNWDDAGNNQAYISGQVAMIFNTGSVINVLKNEHPDLYEKTALAPFPSGPKGQFVPGIDDGLVIFSRAKNPEGAKALATLLMDKEWYEEWLNDGAPLCLPIYEEISKTGIWTDEKVNKPFVDQIPAFKFIGYPRHYSPKDGEIYNLRTINDTFQKILSGESIDSALAWAESEINKVYSKN